MRLLSRAEDGTFHITYYYENVPPYAILSHTWGTRELTYDIWQDGHDESLDGYDYTKLHFLADQASEDGISYFWIDTCCIDKRSSAELTEAINSMFRWYQGAKKCYVYLNDVQSNDTDQFKSSRWHTRSWTLLELLAPTIVEFFSASGKCLGNKQTLETLICSTTGIPADALRGSPLSSFSTTERLRWSENRHATREEDQAYALMGLFNVSMSIIYGEGRSAAFGRLQSSLRNGSSIAEDSSPYGIRMLMAESAPLRLKTVPFDDNLQYAILSHTWGEGEVSFEDMRTATFEQRRGYRKIKKSCELAASHGFEYIWADTCCIDKSSSSELQEAICSMYKWYAKATICYVYLADYDPDDNDSLTSCRWFKRGWTLQELIAPNNVIFYDQNWNEVGTKLRLCRKIASITSIDEEVFRTGFLEWRSVAEKMSWAASRSTSRVEDIAYSLMGLFNVFMPMLYGEGTRAFERLQEEILKQTEDYSIFSWRAQSLSGGSRGIFAQSPAEFMPFTTNRIYSSILPSILGYSSRAIPTSEVYYPYYQLGKYPPPSLTSRGLVLTLPMMPDDQEEHTQLVWVSTSGERGHLWHGGDTALCIRLQQDGLCSSLLSRASPSKLVARKLEDLRDFSFHTVCILPFGGDGDWKMNSVSGEITVSSQVRSGTYESMQFQPATGVFMEGQKITFTYKIGTPKILALIRLAMDVPFSIMIGHDYGKRLWCWIVSDWEMERHGMLLKSMGEQMEFRFTKIFPHLNLSDRVMRAISDTEIVSAAVDIARSDLPGTRKFILRITVTDRT